MSKSSYKAEYEAEKSARILVEKQLDEKTKEVDTGLNILSKQYEDLIRTQKQLVRSEKLASIGQLAAGVAHEINNPVGFVLSNLEVMSDYLKDYHHLVNTLAELAGKDNELCKQLMEKCDFDYMSNDAPILIAESLEGLKRVREIVADLNQFARISNDKTEIININEVAESATKIVWNQLKYSCRLCFDLAATKPIDCHSGQISQVLVNLLVNASHAVQARQGENLEQGVIEVITKDLDHAVGFGVRDNGVGIPDEVKEKIFDPFFTTKPVGQGTGLGLSTAIGIVEKHNGKIHVESEPGQGAFIWIEIPVASA